MTVALTTPVLSPVASAYEAAVRPVYVYLDERLAPGSRRTMREALDVIARELTDGAATWDSCPWAALRYEYTAGLPMRLLGRGYSRATVTKMLSALRGVLREAWRLGLMDAETYQRASDIRPPRGERLAPNVGRAITSGELRALFEACARDRNRAAGQRDAAMLALLYGCGLRRAELVALSLGDYDAATGRLTVRGKGNKERTAYVAGGAIHALARWLEVRHPLTDTPTSPVFVPITKGKRLVLRRLTDQTVFDRLQRRASEAHIPPFSPHDMRRTFVGDLLDAGADIATVQQLAGHASVTTTARYDRRGERAKRGATALLHVPYST